MNKKIVLYILGRVLLLEAVLLSLPTICSLIYKENCVYSFLITITIAAVLGLVLILLNRTNERHIFAKEGFAIVALCWIFMSLIGCLPFVISGEIPRFTDAFFETVSGFTTTGASILTKVESLSRGMLFWRSFTHWVGGMGVLVLVMAVVPTDTNRSMYLMRAEMPGPIVGKLVPKIKSTAKILYLIYIALTLVMVGFLLAGKMSLFDSLLYTFGTAGTGGFGATNAGMSAYSPYIQWVVTIFMLIFGINFNLYYLILTRKIVSVLKSEELWTYLSIIAASTAIIAFNIHSSFDNLADTVRHSAFQVSSIITTTGFATVDFNLWPTMSKSILLILMLFGGCAGSTAGGIKISRVVLIFKTIKSNLKQMLHSRSVESIRFEGKVVDGKTVNNVICYLAIYCLCFLTTFLLISFEPFDIETALSATAACFNNVGPAFSAAGPTSNYSIFSDFSKYVLSGAMLLGRLEIFPLLLLFSPTAWRRVRKQKLAK